ncbi:TNF receptor-associated factor 3-like [Ornithodoros turicata]|uniref:TNF receptor-associated factor 3-like n=1 Tax=Ornithodoros turicata TaxID=34597 RepID=UPI003138C08A
MSSICYLHGHFEALEWRPLQFVNLPSTISCDLCAAVPQNIFRLECFHSLCEYCYLAVLRTNRQCPVDQQGFQENEVHSIPIRTTHLQKLDVRCCNFNRGCDFVGSLERMKSHFLMDCEFHSLACKKCCATVLRKDIITHYMEEGCGAEITLCLSEVVSIDRSLIGIGSQINASLSDIADKLRAIENQVNSHAVGIDATKEYVMNYAEVLGTLQEAQSAFTVTMSNVIRTVTNTFSSIEDQLGNQVAGADDLKNRVIATGETLSTLVGLQKDVAQNAVTSNDGWKQCSEKLEAMSKRIQDLSSSTEDKLRCIRDAFQAPRDSIGYRTNVAFFHMEGVDEIKERATEKRVAETYSDVFALCGYSMKLQVQFREHDGIIYIGVFLCICRGPKDSLLKWPFLSPYKLILVHPTDEKNNIEHTVDASGTFDKFPNCFNRPIESSNKGYGWSTLCKFEDALNGGFVHKNSIIVGVTLVQSRE